MIFEGNASLQLNPSSETVMAVSTSKTSSQTAFVAVAPFSSARTRWLGRGLTGVALLFLAMDATIKVFGVREAIDGTTQLGYPAHFVLPLGLVECTCLILYAVPRTATLGVVLWTGYLGGAIASNLRLGLPLFSHVLFPTYVAAFLWGGLYFRDTRVRRFFSALDGE